MQKIDKYSQDDTRKAACKDSYCAYRYARDADKEPKKGLGWQLKIQNMRKNIENFSMTN